MSRVATKLAVTFCLLLSVFLQVHASSCGIAVVTVNVKQIRGKCIAEVGVSVALNALFTDPLDDVAVGGQYRHEGGVFRANIISPGTSRTISGNRYSDVFPVNPFGGVGYVSISYIRAYSNNVPGQFCVGQVPEFPVLLSSTCTERSFKKRASMFQSFGDDVVLVLDATGSMEAEIRFLTRSITSVLDALNARSAAWRMGIVIYRGPLVQMYLDFTDSTVAIFRAIKRLDAIDGRNQELVYSGVKTAFDMNWGLLARRVVIVVGDTIGKDPESLGGLSLGQISALADQYSYDPDNAPTFRALSFGNTTVSQMDTARQIIVPVQNIFRVHCVSTSDDPTVVSFFVNLAARTGGNAVTSSPRRIGTALIGLLNSAVPAINFVPCSTGVLRPVLFASCSGMVNTVFVKNMNACIVSAQYTDLMNDITMNVNLSPGVAVLFSTFDTTIDVLFKWNDPPRRRPRAKRYTFTNC